MVRRQGCLLPAYVRLKLRGISIYVCCLGLQCSLCTCIVVISNSKEKIDTDIGRRVVMVVEYGLRSK